MVHVYQPEDATALDALLNFNRGHGVRLDLDRIVLSGPPARPTGCLVWRPIALIHELIVPHTLGIRAIARQLVEYAAKDSGFREAAFLVDRTNGPMLQFALEAGAVERGDSQLFMVPIKPGGQLDESLRPLRQRA